ncbi:hypothetical protein [Variovorax sp. efr-133-TYG-130]|jgi:hypothetical protein|uniref:hypothetical protein n=1 Tax=Variovorax sp. efr-133-TYG-130 TaxID=3040327 RepID=UPI002554DED8|nr:hypothetical protein [Variovorax sp. efr-133-TYG-130]
MTASTVNDSLTPLDISQAVLEGEENPNVARPLSPKEQAATGVAQEQGRRARLQRALRSPAFAWGGAAVTGLALAMLYARRTHRI